MASAQFQARKGLKVGGRTDLLNTAYTYTVLPATNTTYNIGSSTEKYSNMYATTFNGRATSADWSDLAERYEADKEYEEGTLLAIGGEKEVTKYMEGMPYAGVVSSKPGFQMNNGEDKQSPLWPFICLKGRIPVKISEPVQKGDYLVAGNDGKAKVMKGLTVDHLSLVGIALSDSSGETVEVKV